MKIGDKVKLSDICRKRFHLLDGNLAFTNCTLFFDKEYEISEVLPNGYKLKGMNLKYPLWEELITSSISK